MLKVVEEKNEEFIKENRGCESNVPRKPNDYSSILSSLGKASIEELLNSKMPAEEGIYRPNPDKFVTGPVKKKLNNAQEEMNNKISGFSD